MKKMIFLVCALFFVLTGFNQQERIVEQGNVEILGGVSAVGYKPEITQELMNVRVNEGGIAVFLAQFVPIDDPTLRIEWYCDGVPVKLGTRIKAYKDDGTATLVINKVEPEDAGIYEIKVSNALGEALSSARLTVTE
ncbi:immunoglobulin domain-containing protein [Butyricimonas sp.]|uniref:immunoglobulin domain-containing protein n=1 Tax=Butyricimonas sp. TaxID=1969738 RepID=UPI0025C0230D|nr:immunoglobulin domain-containing protein [Butyricimonas sp.]